MSKAAVYGAYLSGKTHRPSGAAKVLGLAVATRPSTAFEKAESDYTESRR